MSNARSIVEALNRETELPNFAHRFSRVNDSTFLTI